MTKFTAAFHCDECPRNGDPANGPACPAWWEWAAENAATGETRIERMCGWQAMPIFLTEVIKASNRPAAAVESTRNEIAAGLTTVAQRISAGFARIQASGVTRAQIPALPPQDILPPLDRLGP